MAAYFYGLERDASQDLTGRCGHCGKEGALAAWRVTGANALGRFFLGISPAVPALVCPACGKSSQKLSGGGKALVAFAWGPLTVMMAAGGAYLAAHAEDMPEARTTSIVLGVLALIGLAIMVRMAVSVFGKPLYPVAGRPIEKDGKVFWGR